MCDLETADRKSGADSEICLSLSTAAEDQMLALDTISLTSDSSLEADQRQLHQTTQSLLMASSMMAGIAGTGGQLLSGTTPAIGSGSAFGSTESVGTTVSAVNTIKINIEELLRENYALRERLKEVTSDRDRLLCEVSNLRLELDMSELKRLPAESQTNPEGYALDSLN